MRRTIGIIAITILVTTSVAYSSGYQATFLNDVMVPRRCELTFISVDIDCPCPCASNGVFYIELLDAELDILAVAMLQPGWCCYQGERLIALDRTVKTCELAYIRAAVSENDSSSFWLGLKIPTVNCGRVCWQSIFKGDLDEWSEYALPDAYLAVPRYVRPQHTSDLPVTPELVPPAIPEVGVVVKPELPTEEQHDDTGVTDTTEDDPDAPADSEETPEVQETIVVEGLG